MIGLNIVIGVLNPVMSAMFAVSLFFLWNYQKKLTYIAILVASYAIRTVCFLVLYAALVSENMALRQLANLLILLANALVSVAIARRMGRSPRYWLLLVIILLTMAGLQMFLARDSGLYERSGILNVGLFAICMVMLSHLDYRAARSPVERLLYILICLAGLCFLVRPFIARFSQLEQADYSTFYWVFTAVSDVIVCSTLAVAIFALIASDVMVAIRDEAYTDMLSGLFNRRGFEQRVKAVLQHETGDRPAAMLMGDLDHFKKVNDRCGHARGDEVIRLFAQTLKECAPPRTIIGRLGGEEFAIFLMENPQLPPRLFAENVRAAFNAAAPGIVDGVLSPTASMGIAFAREWDDYSSLLERADRALYRAKESGRNCVQMDG